jgi:hypothetical protein
MTTTEQQQQQPPGTLVLPEQTATVSYSDLNRAMIWCSQMGFSHAIADIDPDSTKSVTDQVAAALKHAMPIMLSELMSHVFPALHDGQYEATAGAVLEGLEFVHPAPTAQELQDYLDPGAPEEAANA